MMSVSGEVFGTNHRWGVQSAHLGFDCLPTKTGRRVFQQNMLRPYLSRDVSKILKKAIPIIISFQVRKYLLVENPSSAFKKTKQ